jgi:hypothetical protein
MCINTSEYSPTPLPKSVSEYRFINVIKSLCKGFGKFSKMTNSVFSYNSPFTLFKVKSV